MTVSGAVGGIGTSTVAYALSLAAGPGSILIDAAPVGVPIDILIGAEGRAGARWSQVRVRSGEIGADVITAGLPEHLGLRVLSADAGAVADSAALAYIVHSLRHASTAVVVDLPARHPGREALRPDLDLLLLPATLPGIAAARIGALPSTGLVVVDTGRADVQHETVGDYVGRPVLGRVRWQRSITSAALAGVALPDASDVMQLATKLLRAVSAGD